MSDTDKFDIEVTQEELINIMKAAACNYQAPGAFEELLLRNFTPRSKTPEPDPEDTAISVPLDLFRAVQIALAGSNSAENRELWDRLDSLRWHR